MAILLKVEWVNMDDSVRHIGGSSKKCEWQHSVEQAIRYIEHDEFVYYFNENAQMLKLEVGVSTDGRKYLKTSADDSIPVHLLNLPARSTHPFRDENVPSRS